MGAWGDVGGDFPQMKVHGGAVADGQDETGTNPSGRTNGTEEIGRAGALVVGCDGPCSTLGPAACDFVLLPDPGLVLPPDLYRGAVWQDPADRCELAGKVFLKAATALGSWA